MEAKGERSDLRFFVELSLIFSMQILLVPWVLKGDDVGVVDVLPLLPLALVAAGLVTLMRRVVVRRQARPS